MGLFDKIAEAFRAPESPTRYDADDLGAHLGHRPRITSAPTSPDSAMDTESVRTLAPGTIDLYKSAGLSLTKRNLLGERAAVYLVLDRSASMNSLYARGTVQRFAEKALALSAHFDDDGIVPTFAFGSDVYGPIELDVRESEGAVSTLARTVPEMYDTRYAPAIEAVASFHMRESESKMALDDAAPAPGFVIFQTDGQASDPQRTIEAIRKVSHLPIFFQFVGFGGVGPESFGLLNDLDELDGRLIDNAGFYWAGRNPDALSDMEIFDGLMNEFPEYLDAARRVFTN